MGQRWYNVASLVERPGHHQTVDRRTFPAIRFAVVSRPQRLIHAPRDRIEIIFDYLGRTLVATESHLS